MFTGIVEEVGTVERLERHATTARLRVTCSAVLDDAAVGDSIAVNGCCLTVTSVARGGVGFGADVMGETLVRTGLGDLAPGFPVNLERALPATGRLGGHLVQGHIDGVGEVTDVADQGEWTLVTIRVPEALVPYLAEKGSVAVDGVSLTVVDVEGDHFRVGLVPHTLAVTTLGRCGVGDRVNIETDIVAKYVRRLLRV